MNEEEIKRKKKEALVDYNKANNELRKSNIKLLKRILIVFSIIFVICLLIRVIHGRVYYSISFLGFNKSVEYNLYINDEHKAISFEDTEDSPIIPGLLYFRRSNSGGWFNMNKLNEDIIFDEEDVILDFEVNECYTHTDMLRVNCDSSNEKLIRKKIKPKFTRIFIRKNGKHEDVKYDGKFINNISKYVKDKGYYYIEVYAEYDGIETKLYFYSTRVEEV